MAPLNKSQTNHRLGYPDEARLLILNVDDLGMCNAVNEGIFRTLEAGVVRSTTLMVPCLWAWQAKDIVKEEGIILVDYRALQAAWKGK